jgi:hypothetical protein
METEERAAHEEDGVVERPRVFVEHRIRTDQLLVPRHAHPEVSDRDRDVRDCRKVSHVCTLPFQDPAL